MQMTCSDSLVQMYVEGDMGAPERAIVEAHLAECSRCRADVAAYKALMWDVGHLAEPEVPAELPDLSDRLMEAWQEHQEKQKKPSWAEASLHWTRTTPVVGVALGSVARLGWAVPRVSVKVLSWLGGQLFKGGGRR